MANFSRKVVLVFLCCLSHTYIGCAENKELKLTWGQKAVKTSSILSTVKDPLVPKSSCGAVWIGKETLLTAASCFDHEGKTDFSKHKDAYNNIVKDVTIEATFWGKTQKGDYGLIEDKIKGKALIHPLFKRNNDEKKMPLAYDLAVVLADVGKYERTVEKPAEVCKEKKDKKDLYEKNKIWIAAVVEEKVKEWELQHDNQQGMFFVSIISTSESATPGQWYHIDPNKQFVSKLDIKKEQMKNGIISPSRYGAPVFDKIDEKKRCVAGIISFAGQEKGSQYITSTKVVPFTDWIAGAQWFLMSKNEEQKKLGLDEMDKKKDPPIDPHKKFEKPGTLIEDIEKIGWKQVGLDFQ